MEEQVKTEAETYRANQIQNILMELEHIAKYIKNGITVALLQKQYGTDGMLLMVQRLKDLTEAK